MTVRGVGRDGEGETVQKRVSWTKRLGRGMQKREWNRLERDTRRISRGTGIPSAEGRTTTWMLDPDGKTTR